MGKLCDVDRPSENASSVSLRWLVATSNGDPSWNPFFVEGRFTTNRIFGIPVEPVEGRGFASYLGYFASALEAAQAYGTKVRENMPTIELFKIPHKHDDGAAMPRVGVFAKY